MAGSSPAIRVAIVDDHPIVIKGLVSLLREAADFEVVATATEVAGALTAVRRKKPDVLILDLRLGEVLASDVIADFTAASPETRIVILTAFDHRDPIRLCIEAGARGVLLKDAGSLDLSAALRRIVAGEKVVDGWLSSRGFHDREQALYELGGYDRLTAREYEVLRLIAQGMNTRDVALELQLKPNTVRSYTQSVLEKLQASNRVMAVANARRMHLI